MGSRFPFLVVASLLTVVPMPGRDAIAGQTTDASPSPTVLPRSVAYIAGPSGMLVQYAPVGIEARTVSAIEDQGRATIVDLVSRLNDTRDPAIRQALSAQIIQTKLDVDLETLQLRATYARARGDEASARQFENSISMLLHPVIKAPVSTGVKPGGPLPETQTPNIQPALPDMTALSDALYTGLPVSQDAGLATGNIDNTVTRPGWTRPIVARGDATATLGNCQPSAELPNESYNVYISWSFEQSGDTLPPYDYLLYIDDVLTLGGAFGAPVAPSSYVTMNVGPIAVFGGRHTLKSVSDLANAAAETNETDNSFSTEYIFTPYHLNPSAYLDRYAPSNPGTNAFPLVNADGYRYDRPSTSYAWVIGAAAENPGDDYDLAVFDDYSGATAGFSNAIGMSRWGNNLTDFVAGHYSLTPATVYPAVSFYAGAGGSGNFGIDRIDASSRNGGVDMASSWTLQELPPNRVADVYEGYFTAGTQWYFILRRRSGPSDLAFEVYPGTPGLVHRRGVGAASSAPTGGTVVDVLGPYTSTESGWHPIVVYRDNGTNSDQWMTYDFSWNTVGFVDVPADRGSDHLTFSGATPNPLVTGGSFDFTLPTAGRATLALFDLGGRRVRSLDGDFTAGRQSLRWDGQDATGAQLGAGMYWAQLTAGGQTISKAIVVMR